MGRTLSQIKADLPKARRRAIDRRTQELLAEELSLRDLRKALQLTQTDVAKALGKGQDAVSRIEQREDLLLSTLHGYVQSLGGELELVCTFKDREPIRIKSQSFLPAGKVTRRAARQRALAD
jgi:transcriptional regulator with XRE-family HTH domain